MTNKKTVRVKRNAPTPKVVTKKKPVRERNYLYGEKATKVIIVRITEKEHKKVMRKVGNKTITEWFKKIAKID